MKLRNGTFQGIAKDIKENNKKLVVYGAGMIGTVFTAWYIDNYDLFPNLICYCDGDQRKQGTFVKIGDNKALIESPDRLKDLPENTVIFITNSSCYPIVKMMDEMPELDDRDAYIIPVLQVLATHEKHAPYHINTDGEPLIPKVINYCWFSRKPIPEALKRCMNSWHKFCPDYDFICWNEDNYDIEKVPYMKEAYEKEKYSYVTDYARLDILYNHGGFYLDTDVELIKNLDELRYLKAFIGTEKWGSVNTGGLVGAIPFHSVIKKMLDFRKGVHFVLSDGTLNMTTCGYYETTPLIQLGMRPNNTVQDISGMTVFSSDFFHPFDYMSAETTITENTYSIHYFSGGWLDEESLEMRKRTQKQYQELLERMNSDDKY